MKHESFQCKVHDCLLQIFILINCLRSVRAHRCGPITRGLETSTARLRRFRRGVDNLCRRNRLLVVEGRSCRKCETHRKYSRSDRCVADRFKAGGEGEPMAMCMHTMKVGAWRNVCFLPLRGSTPKSQRQDS